MHRSLYQNNMKKFPKGYLLVKLCENHSTNSIERDTWSRTQGESNLQEVCELIIKNDIHHVP